MSCKLLGVGHTLISSMPNNIPVARIAYNGRSDATTEFYTGNFATMYLPGVSTIDIKPGNSTTKLEVINIHPSVKKLVLINSSAEFKVQYIGYHSTGYIAYDDLAICYYIPNGPRYMCYFCPDKRDINGVARETGSTIDMLTDSKRGVTFIQALSKFKP